MIFLLYRLSHFFIDFAIKLNRYRFSCSKFIGKKRRLLNVCERVYAAAVNFIQKTPNLICGWLPLAVFGNI